MKNDIKDCNLFITCFGLTLVTWHAKFFFSNYKNSNNSLKKKNQIIKKYVQKSVLLRFTNQLRTNFTIGSLTENLN